MKKSPIPAKLVPWFEARRKHRLSHAHIQMARELGLNPKKFGSLDNHQQQPWKAPLPEFIEHIYFKHFGKNTPDEVLSLEEVIARQDAKKEKKRIAKQLKRAGETE